MNTIRICIPLLLLMAMPSMAQTLDRIIIPHGLHLENDIDCATCHDGVESSTDAFGSYRPDMDVCADCHDVDDDKTCIMCHTDLDTVGEWEPPTRAAQLFSHGAHMGSGMECADCHGDLAAAPPAIPGKDRCRECHDTADDYADCRMCHAGDEDLVPFDHRAGWENRHGLAATCDPGRCDQCHGPSACLDCHAGDNVEPRVHALGFAYSHALQARGHAFECATCHQEQDDCIACHRAERVLPQNHSRGDWLRPTDGGAHASEGLFDMESCVSCHDEGASEPTCARCHGG